MKIFFYNIYFYLINNNLRKFLIHNYSVFNSKKIKSKKIILVEFNNWHPLHISFSYVSNFLSKKYNAKLYGYTGYTLISEKLYKSLSGKIKFFIGNLLRINNFAIYRSFGVDKIFYPKISKDVLNKSNKNYKKIKKKIKTKKDILNLKIENIEIGDLVYDTYLKNYEVPTVDILDKKFQYFLKDTIIYFYYWKNFFENNDVVGIVTGHSVYTFAIPLRIAISRKVPSFTSDPRSLYQFNKKNQLCETEFKYFSEKFKQLPGRDKVIGLKEAKRRVELRLKGKVGVDMSYSKKSAFGKMKPKRIIDKNNRIKVLIATHCFFDAPNAIGKLLFSDFYEWIKFLGNFSKSTDYDWYIKTHPDYKKESYVQIKKLVKKFPRLKLINSNISHHQLKKEGINFALTCYGTIGFEYALLGIPVINASVNNPHINYNFNFHPSSLNEYKKLLKNLKNLKLNIKKKEIYEYYFMMHIYYSKDWLFNDIVKIENDMGGFRKIYNQKIYQIWMNEFTSKKHLNILENLKSFTKSKNFRLSYINLNQDLKNEIKKGKNIN